MTYDLKDDYLKEGYPPELVAECDSIVTIDAIDAALQKLGHETVRIGNVKALGFLAGKSCDLVFNIAEVCSACCVSPRFQPSWTPIRSPMFSVKGLCWRSACIKFTRMW